MIFLVFFYGNHENRGAFFRKAHLFMTILRKTVIIERTGGKKMQLVLIRHGESEANFQNYWTGWLDVPLTSKGRLQAQQAGEKIKSAKIEFDQAYTSVLQRSLITCQEVLESCDQLWIPTEKTWRLNERHYGALVGKNKDEMKRQFGEEQVKRWRRGFYQLPPFVEQNHFDRRYAHLDPSLLPKGESLALTLARVLPLWQDQLAPALVEGKNLLVVGHGNSLRALVKYLEEIPDEDVDQIDIPNATPVLYEFTKDLQIKHKILL